MSVNWYDSVIKQRIKAKEPTFLRAVGEALVNQMVVNAHYDTGLLINSMNYKVFDGSQNEFGKEPSKNEIKKGTLVPPETARVSRPDRGFVRAGSALVYAGRQEGHNAWCTKSIDAFRREKNWLTILKRVYANLK